MRKTVCVGVCVNGVMCVSQLMLRIESDRPLVYDGVAPNPSESLELAPGVGVSHLVLLSEQDVYAFVLSIAASAAGDVIAAAVLGFIRSLRAKNPGARFELEQEEVDFDHEGHIRRILKTRIKQG